MMRDKCRQAARTQASAPEQAGSPHNDWVRKGKGRCAVRGPRGRCGGWGCPAPMLLAAAVLWGPERGQSAGLCSCQGDSAQRSCQGDGAQWGTRLAHLRRAMPKWVSAMWAEPGCALSAYSRCSTKMGGTARRGRYGSRSLRGQESCLHIMLGVQLQHEPLPLQPCAVRPPWEP